MKILVVLAAALASAVSLGQAFSLTSFSPGYQQNFDTLPSSGSTSLTGNSLVGTGFNLPEWVFADTGSKTLNAITADNGNNTNGGIYSYGSTGSSDRALGSLDSTSSSDIFTGLRLVNNTGHSTGLFVIQFDLEQWRQSGTSATLNHDVLLSYKLYSSGTYSNSDLKNGTGFQTANIVWQTIDQTTAVVGSQHFSNIIALPGTGSSSVALNGNLAANRLRIRAVVQLFNAHTTWNNGEEIVFRFGDTAASCHDNGFGLDNVIAVPEPSSIAIFAIGGIGLLARRRRKH